MKFIAILAAAVALTGCASTGVGFNNTEVVVAKQYVVRTAPDQMKTLPPLPPKLVKSLPGGLSSNNDVATFMNNTEEYVANLEAMIQTLVNFYEAPVTSTEAGTLQPVTPRSPAQPTPGRVIQPQTTAANASAATVQPPASTSKFFSAFRR